MSQGYPRPIHHPQYPLYPSPVVLPASSDTIVASSPAHGITQHPDSMRRPYPIGLSSDAGLVGVDGSLKRRKISPTLYENTGGVQGIPTPITAAEFFQPPHQQPSKQSSPLNPVISTPALLYSYAQSAHAESQTHLQQSFIPPYISADRKSGYPIARLYPPSPPMMPPAPQATPLPRYTHDSQARQKALGYLLLALDLLRAGLKSNELSDREKVVFALEFGLVGVKVWSAWQSCSITGKERGKNESGRLMDEMQEFVGQASLVAERQSSLALLKLQLELLNARLAFMQGKFNLGKRLVRNGLAACKNDHCHRYGLYLLHLEHIETTGPGEYLNIVTEFLNEAERNKHQEIVQLASLLKARIAFVHRRWELVPSTLVALAGALNSPFSDHTSVPADLLPGASELEQSWLASMHVHYLTLKALWEGRRGDDAVTKAVLKQVYALMDMSSDKGTFNALRASGGVFMLPLPNSQPLLMQLTPPNITYMLTYLTTVVTRREFTGSIASCRTLVHAKVFKETEHVARAEDMWDIGFSGCHGLADVVALQRKVASIRAEVSLEQATALMYRGSFKESLSLLYETVDYLQKNDIFAPLSPQLCLLFAQHAHLLGLTETATRYYTACKALINTGSELSLIAEIGILGARSKLEGLMKDLKVQDEVNGLAEKCKGSTSATFSAAGQFLASMTDDNRVNSKKKLSTAYEISQKANNHILRLLIFAYTTSTHHYGGRQRMQRQLETGKDIAKMLGGKDRPDGVGQVVLGWWFARRLKEFYRQEGAAEAAAEAKQSEKVHLERLQEVRREAEKMFKDK
ncbi:hypothetical protein L202_08258 [Cryptococcus amylolentus CBS 6039]|uniref:Uncharacterized protein n=1 Tax=Cryptococcus amylolentus CBS 6039 TaxID=1295533 RepID=A0A1E3H9L5_9TREE|nr:hypothetical protein L202_08258 [Cryptococcus amylolentus CBS 6039]ODN72825.1 hypothetical protein L202_08258 [Cryptococcus amylolentus CBS 6039]